MGHNPHPKVGHNCLLGFVIKGRNGKMKDKEVPQIPLAPPWGQQ